MQASLILLLLSASSSSLALPPQSVATQDLDWVIPQCYALDPGTDDTWRDECQWLVDLFHGQTSLPRTLFFGAGGIPVPYIYRGPMHETVVQCEIRIDLLNNAQSDSIEKWRLWAAGELLIQTCVKGMGLGHRLGGRMAGFGRNDNLNIALGKIPVPEPPAGDTPAVKQPVVDVT